MRSIAIFACLVWLCAACAGQSHPPGAPALPSVAEVEARFVAALGGREAILRPRSMTKTGTETVHRGGHEIRGELLEYEAPFRHAERLSIPGRGVFRDGYDGERSWSASAGQPVEIHAGTPSERRDADLYYWAHVLDYFQSMETVEVAEFEGHRCYHLRGATKWGKVNNHFYDTTTGLLIGYEFRSDEDGAAIHQVYDDYRSIAGLLVPMRITVKREGAVIVVIELAALTIDDVPPGAFVAPT